MHVYTHIQAARTRGHVRRTRKAAGYTATEMMVASCIMVIFALIAVTNHVGRMPSYVLDQSVIQIMTDLREARMEAVSENIKVRVTFDVDARAYTLWKDRNGNGKRETGEESDRSLHAGEAVNMTVLPDAGDFHPQGTFKSTNGIMRIVLSTPDVGERSVRVMKSGHVAWLRSAD